MDDPRLRTFVEQCAAAAAALRGETDTSTEANAHAFLHNEFPGTIARVLSTEYKIDNLVTASAFLTQAADLLPLILAQPTFHSLPLFKVLPQLLGSPRNEAKFFKDNKPTLVAAGLAANTKAAPELVTLHNAAKQSAFAALNVKYFVLAGGLDRLALLLSPSAFCGSVSWWAAVTCILDAFTGAFSYLTAESTLKLSAAVVAALSQCIGQLTDAHIKSSTKDEIEQFLLALDRFSFNCHVPKSLQAAQCSEQCRLAIALRLFECEFLFKRVIGITVINDTIDRVRTAAVAPGKDARYFDSASLSIWLVEHKLIESLFGEQSHVELWQRSQSILMFLLLHSRFTEAHLQVVWRALVLVRYSDAGLDYTIMEQLIMTIALRLPLTLLHCLWRLMSSESDSPPAALWSVNVSKLDDKQRDQRRMQLVGKFATVALAAEAKLIKEEAKRTWFGLQYFWECLQPGSGLPVAAQQFACDGLIRLLQRPECVPQRMFALETAMSTLSQRVFPDIGALVKIAGALLPLTATQDAKASWGAKPGKSKTSMDTVIADLDERFAVLNTVFSDTCTWKCEDSTVYLSGVNLRLRFVEFWLLNSDQTLSATQLVELWQALFESQSLETVRQCVCEFFINGTRASRKFYSDSSAAVFFANALSKSLCSPSASLAVFRVFAVFFLELNQRKGYMSVIESPVQSGEFALPRFVVINPASLIGIDTIWNAALTIESSDIWVPVAVLLLRCTLQLAPMVQDKQQANSNNLQSMFVERCLAALPSTRALLLLRMFIDTVQAGSNGSLAVAGGNVGAIKLPATIQSLLSAHANEEMIVVQFVLKPGPDTVAFSSQYPVSAALSSLRSHAALKIDHPESLTELQFKGFPINDYRLAVSELRGTSSADVISVQVWKRNQVSTQTQASSSACWIANQLVGNIAQYNKLFALLESNVTSIAQAAWQLLDVLPPSPAISARFDQIIIASAEPVATSSAGAKAASPKCEKNPWAVELNAQLPVKLLYSLRILEAKVLPRWALSDSRTIDSDHKDDSDAVDEPARAKFSANFIKQGVPHLLLLLENLRIQSKQSVYIRSVQLQSVSIIIRLLSFLSSGVSALLLLNPSLHQQLMDKASEPDTLLQTPAFIHQRRDRLLKVLSAPPPVAAVAPAAASKKTDKKIDKKTDKRPASAKPASAPEPAKLPSVDPAVLAEFSAWYDGIPSCLPTVGSKLADSLLSLLLDANDLSEQLDASVSAISASGNTDDLFLSHFAGGPSVRAHLIRTSMVIINCLAMSLILDLARLRSVESLFINQSTSLLRVVAWIQFHSDSILRRALSFGLFRLTWFLSPDVLPVVTQHLFDSTLAIAKASTLNNLPKHQLLSESFALILLLLRGVDLRQCNSIDKQQCSLQLIGILDTLPTGRESVDVSDAVVRGCLDVLLQLLTSSPISDSSTIDHLIDLLINRALFRVPPTLPLCTGLVSASLCEHRATRGAAFALLHFLVNDFALSASTMQRTCELIDQFYTPSGDSDAIDVHRTAGWLLNPDDERRVDFVGLQNLGATCYINSLVQQLFHVPEFARAIQSLDAKSDSSLLRQVQLAFRRLQTSQRRAIDIAPVVSQLRDWDGNPVNVLAQQDVNEFLTVLFDQLEPQLKQTPCPTLLSEHFGGTLLNSLICTECNHVNQVRDPFFFLSVDVKGKPTVVDALRAYFTEESIDGVLCSGCGKKTRATKRARLLTQRPDSTSALPRTLFVHMKRMGFDYEVMQKFKINDRCSFPLQLTLDAFVDDDSMQINNQYDLAGVIVHAGSAEGGHYYSFSKDRASGAWYCFNDNTVTSFDVRELDAETFGGRESNGLEKTRSAYFLLYQHRHARSVHIDAPNDDQYREFDMEVWQDTRRLIRERQLFDARFFDCMWRLARARPFTPCYQLSDTASSEALCTLQVGTRFVFETLCRARLGKGKPLRNWLEHLTIAASLHLPYCVWLLDQLGSNAWLHTTLVQCPDADARDGFAKLFATVAICLSPLGISSSITVAQSALPCGEVLNTFFPLKADLISSCALNAADAARVCESLKTLLTSCISCLNSMSSQRLPPPSVLIVRLLTLWARTSTAVAEWCCSHGAGLVTVLVNLLTGAGYVEPDPTQLKLRRATWKLRFDALSTISLLSTLIVGKSSFTAADLEAVQHTSLVDIVVQLPSPLSVDVESHVLALVQGLARDDIEWSIHTIDCIINRAKDLDVEGFELGLRMLESMLTVQDELQPLRIEHALSGYLEALEVNNLFWRATDVLTHYMLRMAKRSPLVSEALLLPNRRHALMELDAWLNAHAKPPGPRDQSMFLNKADVPPATKPHASDAALALAIRKVGDNRRELSLLLKNQLNDKL